MHLTQAASCISYSDKCIFLKGNWFSDSHLHWDPYQDHSSQFVVFFSGATEAYLIEPYTCLCPHNISWTASTSADIVLVELWRPLPILSVEMCHNYMCPHCVSWTVSISAHLLSESRHKGVTQRPKDVTQTQQQRPESPTGTITWRASKYKVHKLLWIYFFINSAMSISAHTISVELCRSLPACQCVDLRPCVNVRLYACVPLSNWRDKQERPHTLFLSKYRKKTKITQLPPNNSPISFTLLCLLLL